MQPRELPVEVPDFEFAAAVVWRNEALRVLPGSVAEVGYLRLGGVDAMDREITRVHALASTGDESSNRQKAKRRSGESVSLVLSIPKLSLMDRRQRIRSGD